ncbi:GIY-YIG nuclease family protein [uncultured Psychroserpens sp.]|uniref:GIY-YIG nuclease family protein n=1 Tax=uncultured Psychroserpens sp. TaxID=255436 RepID=UPI00261F4E74|nr:GIY-YIG nuclease family protein [uncultured Psychroserpens sp.]
MCCTYILYSKLIDRYYIGYTCDVMSERLRKHNINHSGFTGRTNDWKIVCLENYSNRSEAYARERAIKSKKSRAYIESLIANR